MNIEITSGERDTLMDVLGSELSNLREEIYHTDTFDYKQRLKSQKATIERFLSKLQPPFVQVP